MPRGMLGEEMRRVERSRRADDDFRARVGSYLAVTGRSITDLAMIIGVSPGTLYNRMKKPEDMRLKEYRRIMEELDLVSCSSR